MNFFPITNFYFNSVEDGEHLCLVCELNSFGFIKVRLLAQNITNKYFCYVFGPEVSIFGGLILTLVVLLKEVEPSGSGA